MDLGTSIRMYRKNARFKQYEFAKMCKISNNALSQIENNVTYPHKNTINKMSEILKIPVSFLLVSSINAEDVPENKLQTFNFLKLTMDNLLKEIHKENLNK